MSVKYASLPWDLWQYGKAAVAPRFIFYSLSLGTQRDLLFLVSIFPTQEEHMVVSLAAVDKESIDDVDLPPLANRRGQTRGVYTDYRAEGEQRENRRLSKEIHRAMGARTKTRARDDTAVYKGLTHARERVVSGRYTYDGMIPWRRKWIPG